METLAVDSRMSSHYGDAMARSNSVTASPRKVAARRPAQSTRSIAAPAMSSRGRALAVETRSEPMGRFLSARQFWDLMERWQVPDLAALELLDYSGKIGASGKRPLFRFSPLQKRITSYLPEIDSAMIAGGEDIDWLHKKIRDHPFESRTPIAYMVENGMNGMAEVLRILTEAALRRSLRR